ncbi:MAG: SMC-Scp complex subunit ScpB [Planctomycetota bacterium]
MSNLDLAHVDDGEAPEVADAEAQGSDAELDEPTVDQAADDSDATEAEAAGDPEGEPAAEGEPDGDAKPAKRKRPSGPGPGEALSDEELLRQAAALLFASPDPLGLDRLVQLLDRPTKARVKAALDALALRFEEAQLPFQLASIAGGWRILTHPDYGDVVHRLAKVRGPEKVTPAALETLAIVAYRQPVTNAEVEAIRGVQAGAMLRTLVDRGLIRVTGRADQPGSPLQYGTTREFLDRFGLNSLDDLPRDGELAQG